MNIDFNQDTIYKCLIFKGKNLIERLNAKIEIDECGEHIIHLDDPLRKLYFPCKRIGNTIIYNTDQMSIVVYLNDIPIEYKMSKFEIGKVYATNEEFYKCINIFKDNDKKYACFKTYFKKNVIISEIKNINLNEICELNENTPLNCEQIQAQCEGKCNM